MADDGNVITNLNLDAPAANGEDTGPAAGIVSQYIKDLSVENPNAPASYQWTEAPEIDVQFNIASKQIEGELHEVELKISLTSKSDAGTSFIIDLAYCGLIGMRGLEPEQMHMFTYAEAPRLLFPYARRVISDAVRDAGFPPFMLEPIDFKGLYLSQLQSRQEEVGEPVGTA